ncbi:hypothetical protein BN1708_006319, partial [Verticillium longisporum]
MLATNSLFSFVVLAISARILLVLSAFSPAICSRPRVEKLARALRVLLIDEFDPALGEEALLVAAGAHTARVRRGVLWREEDAIQGAVRRQERAQLVGLHVGRDTGQVDDAGLADGGLGGDEVLVREGLGGRRGQGRLGLFGGLGCAVVDIVVGPGA